MAFTATQLATLEAAAAAGVLQAQIGDKLVRYQSLPDLLAAIRQARDDVAAAATPSTTATYRGTTRYLYHGRGS